MTDAGRDRREEIREAVRRLAAGGFTDPGSARGPVTSDLSIDESLVLHSIGWEPVDLVCGAATWSVPLGYWRWGVGEIAPASAAHNNAVSGAARQMEAECRAVGGHGVVGVRVEVEVERHLVNAVLVGTAVAPVGTGRPPARAFLSDLSGRDFALLHASGWDPVGLAFGASFVYAPRRGAGAALRQSTQNVELVNLTRALYAARESAMERMQSSVRALGGTGVVGVQVAEGPMPFASHAVRFTAWGTALRPGDRPARLERPQVVVSLDDQVVAFEAESLRGRE
ncbi:MAG TPA: heavy metal-binding domain-containing protein [Acidimicrobiales bacterium]|nr:heavy metal-binding domain-containing protein [Acidimicrobiales bacterium]